MKHKSRLKPCPFCGHEIQEIIGLLDLRSFRCRKCGACVSFDNDYLNKNPGNTYKYWNRRYRNGKDDQSQEETT